MSVLIGGCVDRSRDNLTFQQELTKFDMAVVVLQAESIQLEHLLPLIPKVLAVLPTLGSRQVVYISAGN